MLRVVSAWREANCLYITQHPHRELTAWYFNCGFWSFIGPENCYLRKLLYFTTSKSLNSAYLEVRIADSDFQFRSHIGWVHEERPIQLNQLTILDKPIFSFRTNKFFDWLNKLTESLCIKQSFVRSTENFFVFISKQKFCVDSTKWGKGVSPCVLLKGREPIVCVLRNAHPKLWRNISIADSKVWSERQIAISLHCNNRKLFDFALSISLNSEYPYIRNILIISAFGSEIILGKCIIKKWEPGVYVLCISHPKLRCDTSIVYSRV